MSDMPTLDWKTIRSRGGPFPQQAYDFVREGLMHTVKLVHGEEALHEPVREDDSRHVSGQQLCFGLKDYAIRQYGLLARTVLEHWSIRRTEDFGRIVFAMIDAGLMRKTDADNFDDFQCVYEFEEAFGGLSVGEGASEQSAA